MSDSLSDGDGDGDSPLMNWYREHERCHPRTFQMYALLDNFYLYPSSTRQYPDSWVIRYERQTRLYVSQKSNMEEVSSKLYHTQKSYLIYYHSPHVVVILLLSISDCSPATRKPFPYVKNIII